MGFQQGQGAVDSLTDVGGGGIGTQGPNIGSLETILEANDQDGALRAHYVYVSR